MDSEYREKSRIALALDELLLARVFCLSAMDMLAMIPDESVDIVFTDEPYGIQGGYITYKQGEPNERVFAWDTPLPAHLTTAWVYEAARILKPGGVLINCGIASWNTTFENVCGYVGLTFRVHDTWLKTNPPPRLRHGGYHSAHEMLWIATKGTMKRRMKKQRQTELFNWKAEAWCPVCETSFPLVVSNDYTLRDMEWAQDKDIWQPHVHIGPYKHHSHRVGHLTEKPDWLIYRHLYYLSDVGDIIVDPFAGSGTIPLVAARMGRQVLAGDINPKWAKMTRDRLALVGESYFNN